MAASFTTSVDTRFWRMMFVTWADGLLGAARSPEGRFHHSGQAALYLSQTPEGCVIASKRYMTKSDPPRGLYPVRVTSDQIVDLRDTNATAHFGIETTHRAAEWQSIRATGAAAPTWMISDRVREIGLDGMLYASRSQPHLTHLTLFRWNSTNGTTVRPDGPSQIWP